MRINENLLLECRPNVMVEAVFAHSIQLTFLELILHNMILHYFVTKVFLLTIVHIHTLLKSQYFNTCELPLAVLHNKKKIFLY